MGEASCAAGARGWRAWAACALAATAACGGGEAAQSPSGAGGQSSVATASSTAGSGGEAATTTSAGGGSATSAGAGGSEPQLEHGDAMVEVGHQALNPNHVPEIGRLQKSGDRLYYCTTETGLYVADANAPAMPSLMNAGIAGQNRCRTLLVDAPAKRVLAGAVGDGIAPTPLVALYDNASGVGLVQLAVFPFGPGDSPEEMALLAPDTYAVALHDRVAILHYAAGSFTQVAELGGFSNAYGLAVQGDRMYVGDALEGVVVVDVSVPDAPVLLDETPLAGGARSLELADGLLFATAGMDGVSVLDVSNPDLAVLRSTITMPGSAEQASYAGGYLFVAAWHDLRIFDVKDPANPRFVVAKSLETALEFSRVLAVDAEESGGKITVWAGEWSSYVHAYAFDPTLIAPDIRVANQPLQFPRNVTTRTFDVTNDGAETLTTTIAGDGDFTVSPESLTIPPGQSASAEVTFTASAGGLRTGNLILTSPDDPDEPLALINLRAQSPHLGLGDELPAIWQFNDVNPASATNGQTFSMAQLRAGMKAVLFVYWAAWCEAGDKALADIEKVANSYQGAGLRVVAVHVSTFGTIPADTPEHVAASLRRAALTVPVFEDDTQVGGTFQALMQQVGFSKLGAFPLHVLEEQPAAVGAHPVIVYSSREHVPEALEKAIESALAP